MSIFKKIVANRPGRNSFNMSHEKKLTLRMGTLTPIFLTDVVPGDYFKVRTELFIRLLPMFAPMMHRVNVYTHFFFVPNRLVCNEKDWQEFITGGETGDSDVLPPIIDISNSSSPGSIGDYLRVVQSPNNLLKGTLWDYFGLPPVIASPGRPYYAKGINAIPFFGYHLVYNEYYRDQNLQPEINLDYKNAPAWDQPGHTQFWDQIFSLRMRNWEKDYFTSALPFTQKGAPMNVPLAGMAPVVVDRAPGSFGLIKGSNTPVGTFPLNTVRSSSDTTQGDFALDAGAQGRFQQYYDPNGTLSADLGEASNITINDLRTAFQIQRWMERNARGGSRYIEQILSHFGIKTPDFRLQRPEYLGGGKNTVVVSEVLQTSEGTFDPDTDSGSAQGTMAGHGISASNIHGFKKRFNEHGYIIGVMSVMPRTAYQDGIPRHFLRRNRFDYYWPTLAHLGEQPVYNQELFFNPGGSPSNEETFGYQSRYSEYKYIPSSVHGDFRDDLDYWHMGRKFNATPSLNSQFVTADPTERVFAVSGTQPLLCQCYHDVKAVRPMPRFGEPGLIDHN